MQKYIKFDSPDWGPTWVKESEIQCIRPDPHNEEQSLICMKEGYVCMLVAKGTPDYLMMHVIGT